MPLYKLAPSSIPAYISFFNRYAIDNKLSPTVVKGILKQAGHNPTENQVDAVIKSISIDPTGITAQAFIDLVSSYHELKNPETEYGAAFRLYDTHGTGHLTESDLTAMFKQMGVTINVQKLFEEADTDKNGYIEYDEFVALMNR